MKKIILASSSPRRIDMLRENGINPIVIPPDVDETVPADTEPRAAVMFLALKKALCAENLAVEKGYTHGEILIAADTVVVYRNNIIGKPRDSAEAYDILMRLRGNRHTVVTGVAMLIPGAPVREVFCDKSDVYFKDYTDDEITEYINTPEPYDKAGGYAIQGAWGSRISRVEGNVDNVIGFPWTLIQERLQKLSEAFNMLK